MIIPFDPDKDVIAKSAIELGADIIETLKKSKGRETRPLDVAKASILSNLDPKIKEHYGDVIKDHLSRINDEGFDKYHEALLKRKEYNSKKGMYLKPVNRESDWDLDDSDGAYPFLD